MEIDYSREDLLLYNTAAVNMPNKSMDVRHKDDSYEITNEDEWTRLTKKGV